MKHYRPRDPYALDCENNSDTRAYYSEHISAMTAESLHSKSAIAGELAVRDAQIDYLLSLLHGSDVDILDYHDSQLPQFGLGE